ncbi:MAG: hypothetical protein RKO66_16245 [Candidatus Contendobacter sp.]|nr:hypothetical protein [Candidatus Contendobacter sp.]MDS4058541.1 hypothetical protein [Candidatus Contendobacter sp.]
MIEVDSNDFLRLAAGVLKRRAGMAHHGGSVGRWKRWAVLTLPGYLALEISKEPKFHLLLNIRFPITKSTGTKTTIVHI